MSRTNAIVSIIKDILSKEDIMDISQLCLRVRELGYQMSSTRIQMAYGIIKRQIIKIETTSTLVQIVTT